MPGFTTTRCRPAFTLAELLIALGVLATGMSMVAAVFPAALTETQRSVNDVIGESICENALTLARVRLRQTDVPSRWLTNQTAAIGHDNATYPVGDSDSDFGFFLTARYVTADVNDYHLVVVAYRRQTEGGNPRLVRKRATMSNDPDNEDRMVAVFEDATDLQVGSPVIARSGPDGDDVGHYGWIVRLDGATAYLDAAHDTLPTDNERSVYVVAEATATRSPAMYVHSTRTSLPE
ncbi:MAG: hypothetical protein KGY99_05730 [Phycisphaerae bacterium]|nr:hypothetical protein [Phycisphaerae bacterium]